MTSYCKSAVPQRHLPSSRASQSDHRLQPIKHIKLGGCEAKLGEIYMDLLLVVASASPPCGGNGAVGRLANSVPQAWCNHFGCRASTNKGEKDDRWYPSRQLEVFYCKRQCREAAGSRESHCDVYIYIFLLFLEPEPACCLGLGSDPKTATCAQSDMFELWSSINQSYAKMWYRDLSVCRLSRRYILSQLNHKCYLRSDKGWILDGRTDGWMNACAEGCLLQMPRTVSLSQGPTWNHAFSMFTVQWNSHVHYVHLCSLLFPRVWRRFWYSFRKMAYDS